MNKKILSAVLVSGVTLAAATTVGADDFDSKIDAQNSIISNLTAEQSAAQDQITSLQAKVASLQSQQDELSAENDKLEAESQRLGDEIQKLSSKIVARNEALKKQARSAQKGNTTSSYINTLLNSKSVSDAVNRVVAIREVVSANAKMLAQQEADKKELAKKQSENQEAINTVTANKAAIAENQNSLSTQKAQLEVAQLDLASQLASAQDEKDNLVSQKAAAEKAAAEKAAKEKAAAEAKAQAESVAKAQAEAQSQAAAQSESAQSQATANSEASQQSSTVQSQTTQQATVAKTSTSASVSATVSTGSSSVSVSASYSSSNTYPVGQCTWGVKSLASWVGNNWGNANQWIASAQAAGHSVGTTPVAGAVAVWPSDGGGYGHVAYVTSISSSTAIQVMESNYNGNMSIGNYRGTFNPSSGMWGSVYYIYP